MATATTTIISDDSIPSPQTVSNAIARGGFSSTVVDGNTYVTEVTLDQQITNKYQTVNQSTTNYVNEVSGSQGLIQYYSNGTFGSNTFLRYDEAGITLYVTGNANVGNLNTPTIATTNITATGNANVGTLLVSGFSTFNQTVTIGNTSTNRDLAVTGNITAGNVAVGNSGNIRSLVVTGNITADNVDSGNLLTANFVAGVLEVNSNAQPNITSVATTLDVGNIYIWGNTSSSIIRAVDNQPISIGSSNTAGSGNVYTLTVDTDGNIIVPQAASGSGVIETAGDLELKVVSIDYTFNQSGAVDLANWVTANYFTGVITITASSQPNITTVGTLLELTVSNVGIGNITGDNIESLDLTTTANLVVSDTANVVLANVGNLFVTANANIVQLNADNGSVSGNLIVGGNLYVDGDVVSVNVTQLVVEDPVIVLGGGPNGAPLSTNDGKDRGLQLSYYTTSAQEAFMGWDNSNSEFIFGSQVTNASEVITVGTWGNIRANTVIANVTGNIANGNSIVGIAANSNVTVTVAGNANVVVVTGTGANITGYANITGDAAVAGNITADNADLGNLVVANYFTGNIINGTSNIVVVNSSNVEIGIGGSANVLKVTTAGANITGDLAVTANLTAANLVGTLASGNSNIAMVANSNIAVTVAGNANVVVVTGTGANIAGYANITGNITAVNADLGNLVVANYFTGNIINGTSDIAIDLNSDVKVSVAGNPDIFVVTSTGTETTGMTTTTSANITTDITTESASFDIVNANATTVNLAGAATVINIGAATGNTSIKHNLDVTYNTQSGSVFANTGTVQGNVVQASGYIKLPVYADATARDAAITSPADGMMIYNTGTAKFQGYSGGWVDLN